MTTTYSPFMQAQMAAGFDWTGKTMGLVLLTQAATVGPSTPNNVSGLLASLGWQEVAVAACPTYLAYSLNAASSWQAVGQSPSPPVAAGTPIDVLYGIDYSPIPVGANAAPVHVAAGLWYIKGTVAGVIDPWVFISDDMFGNVVSPGVRVGGVPPRKFFSYVVRGTAVNITSASIVQSPGILDWESARIQHVYLFPQRVNWIPNPSFEDVGLFGWRSNGTLTRVVGGVDNPNNYIGRTTGTYMQSIAVPVSGVFRFSAWVRSQTAMLPPSVTATLLEPFDNFTTNSWALANGGSGNPTIVAGRTGTAASVPSFSSASYSIPAGSQADTIIVGCAFRVSGLGSEAILIQLCSDAGATVHGELRWNSAGSLLFVSHSSGLGTSAPGLIVANTWNYVELKVKLSDTVGTVEVRLNGTAVLGPLANQDTRNAGTKTVYDTVKLAPTWYTALYDDLYIDMGTSATFKGDVTLPLASVPSAATSVYLTMAYLDETYSVVYQPTYPTRPMYQDWTRYDQVLVPPEDVVAAIPTVQANGPFDCDLCLLEDNNALNYYYDGSSNTGLPGDFSWQGQEARSYSFWYNNRYVTAARLFGQYLDGQVTKPSLVLDWLPTGTAVYTHWDVLSATDTKHPLKDWSSRTGP